MTIHNLYYNSKKSYNLQANAIQNKEYKNIN
jgi:hypothetical protein